MSDNYTPSTAVVRAYYVVGSFDGPFMTPDEAESQFDQWLAEHDREVAAKAVEGASEDIPPLPSWHQRSYMKHWLRDRATGIREARS